MYRWHPALCRDVVDIVLAHGTGDIGSLTGTVAFYLLHRHFRRPVKLCDLLGTIMLYMQTMGLFGPKIVEMS